MLFQLGVRFAWIFPLRFWVSGGEPSNIGVAVVWLEAWIAKQGELVGTVSTDRFRCIANQTLSRNDVSAMSSPRSCAVGQFLFESVGRTVLSANRGVGVLRSLLSSHGLSCIFLPPPPLPFGLIIPVVANSNLVPHDIGRIPVVEHRDLTPISPSFLVIFQLYQPHPPKMPATTAEPKLQLPMQAPSPALFRTQTGELGGEIVVTQQPVSCPRRESGLK